MAEFVFTSPGLKFKEKSIDFVTRNVGITTLGLIGETQKGPAFEPVFVEDKLQFRNRFGNQSIKKLPSGDLQYELPYAANAYLEESSQLYVTRVLGLSGYDAGKVWAITLSAGVDPSTSGVTSTDTGTDSYTDNIYLGQSIYSIGDSGTYFSGFTKISNTEFTGELIEFTATTYNSGSGTVNTVTKTISATSYTEYENMVLAKIRSRGRVEDNVNLPSETIFDVSDLNMTSNLTNIDTGDLFGTFELTASKPLDPDDVPQTYQMSLDPNSSDFISNVIGNEPKGKKTKIWVEATYPNLIKKLDADGIAYGINTQLIESDVDIYSNYKTSFKTPQTPWVVSQLKGNEIDRLFRFISISDGNSANREIKVSIQNIDLQKLEFDVIVRDFYDTDSNPTILESYTNCSLIEGRTNFIGQRIGTSDGVYDLLSDYIMVELADEISVDSFPAGFEGYIQNNYTSAITDDTSTEGIPPKMMYKLKYNENERLNRNYLGITQSAYNAEGLTGNGIDQNQFNFINYKNDGGNTESGFTKSKGFHMDVNATAIYHDGNELIGQFETGDYKFQTINDVVDPTNGYNDIQSRKFTFAPAGGFDGWDVNRDFRTNIDGYQQGGIFDGVDPNVPAKNDYQAWSTAIDTFSNPEEVTINLFATPGINWSDNNTLVGDTLTMVENRTDTLYIIDSPDVDITQTTNNTRKDIVASNDIVDSLEVANLDSSYAATYFPKIQIRDTQNNVNIFIPPTGEVAKAFAFTDNTRFPWFAAAGLQRGVTDARKAQYRLSLDARDILYEGRINPLVDFADSGTAIFGQKTLLDNPDNALNRINVRRLLLQLKVLISNIATRLVFEQNDQTTIDEFLSKARPILDNVKRERGLEDYRIKMDDTINTPETRDRNELYGEIAIKPTKSVEYIGITFTITPSGASFDEG